jgi:glutamate synthase domain-containing protein 3
MIIDATGTYYRDLNERINEQVDQGATDIRIENLCGQRYIGIGIRQGVLLDLDGIPGNDLGAFMDGATVLVSGNAQDGTGNTMNAGKIVVNGDAGDVLGHSMRGGKIFVKGCVGYRAGIHMKEYADRYPVVVVGKRAGDYFGEYMAGGMLIVLNMAVDSADLADAPSPVGRYVGTGQHGGVIYIRGKVEPWQLGKEVGKSEIDDEDWADFNTVIGEYVADMKIPPLELKREEFAKFTPKSRRPYGRMYAY